MIAWVVGKAFRLTAIGVWIGLVGARWVWDLLEPNRQGGVLDGTLLLAQVTLVLAALALLTSWLPARRAARTDGAVLWSEVR